MGDDFLDGLEGMLSDEVDLEAVAGGQDGGLRNGGEGAEIARGGLPLGLGNGEALTDVHGGRVMRQPHDEDLAERGGRALLLDDLLRLARLRGRVGGARLDDCLRGADGRRGRARWATRGMRVQTRGEGGARERGGDEGVHDGMECA